MLTQLTHANENLSFIKFDSTLYPNLVEQNTVDLGRTRSQDSIGNCYAFTFSKMLEHLCNQDSECKSRGEEISPLYIHQIVKNSSFPSDEGSNIESILAKLKHTNGTPISTVKESCLPFDQTLHKKYFEENWYNESPFLGFEYLQETYQKVVSENCIDCSLEILSEEISKKLPNLKISQKEITEILKQTKALTLDEFITMILNSKECLEDKNLFKSPKLNFHTKTTFEVKDTDYFKKLLIDLIDRNLVAAVSICAGARDENNKLLCGLHSVIIKGYRKYCNSENECNYSFQIQNSWGQDWQDEFNGGWVDADHLIKYSLNKPKNETEVVPSENFTGQITWFEPEKNKIKMNPKTEFKSSSPIIKNINPTISPEENTEAGLWECVKSGNPTGYTDYKSLKTYVEKGFDCKKK